MKMRNNGAADVSRVMNLDELEALCRYQLAPLVGKESDWTALIVTHSRFVQSSSMLFPQTLSMCCIPNWYVKYISWIYVKHSVWHARSVKMTKEKHI